jgi:Flp pilus assembly protein TadB
MKTRVDCEQRTHSRPAHSRFGHRLGRNIGRCSIRLGNPAGHVRRSSRSAVDAGRRNRLCGKVSRCCRKRGITLVYTRFIVVSIAVPLVVVVGATLVVVVLAVVSCVVLVVGIVALLALTVAVAVVVLGRALRMCRHVAWLFERDVEARGGCQYKEQQAGPRVG